MDKMGLFGFKLASFWVRLGSFWVRFDRLKKRQTSHIIRICKFLYRIHIWVRFAKFTFFRSAPRFWALGDIPRRAGESAEGGPGRRPEGDRIGLIKADYNIGFGVEGRPANTTVFGGYPGNTVGFGGCVP